MMRIGEVNAVAESEAKTHIEQIRKNIKENVQDKWREIMDEEYEKEKLGHRNRHYVAWIHFAASAFIEEWDIDWDTEKC